MRKLKKEEKNNKIKLAKTNDSHHRTILFVHVQIFDCVPVRNANVLRIELHNSTSIIKHVSRVANCCL